MNPNLLLAPIAFLFTFCGTDKSENVFKIRHGDDLGIDFVNTIKTNDTLNALTFEYVYNGSGIGVGDFNNDGLEDVFFGGNQVSSELYLNQGNLRFKKCTAPAGLATNRWITGVSVVDINQDGRRDLYLSVGGKCSAKDRENLLFINERTENGIPVFVERAASYGLNDSGYSTMGAFFDYDKDGDPDLYLLNNWLENYNRNNLRMKRINGEAESTDKLYRNNGDNTFTDVSREAGILIEGYGLGVNVSDINHDSWPDVYVSNDFMSNDLLWINQKDGTFRNEISNYLKHQTHNGMGVDVADLNNDKLAEILVVDMLPPSHRRQKLMTPGQNFDHFHAAEKMGYQPQYMRNTLQLNRGKFLDGRMLFSEIAFMAGVSSTDWSWAPLMADFDNDGWKDIFIGNGYRKDVTDLDFIFFGLKGGASSSYGSAQTEVRGEKIFEELDKLPEVKLSNYIFRNSQGLFFEDKTRDWGFDIATFTNGSAYADFDHDGDLDLITNNIDQEVILYENKVDERPDNHFLKLEITEKTYENVKIMVFHNGNTQFFETTPYRGFQSTVSEAVHVGLGADTTADSVQVIWPDQKINVYRNVTHGSSVKISKHGAKEIPEEKRNHDEIYFELIHPFRYTHNENSPSDIKITRTLLHELTRTGPCVAVADVNNDQRDDIFIGGEKGRTSALYVQDRTGTFIETKITEEKNRDDGDALFFDADNDGDFDLYVGGTCHVSIDQSSSHQLYLNNGKGKFTLTNSIPALVSPTASVVATDFDNDGDNDLFVGGGFAPAKYPYPARSYLLKNDGGIFKDVTKEYAEALLAPGMVSAALWVDVNKDSLQDLVIAGEWMPIRIFVNRRTSFKEETTAFGLAESDGWWNCLKAADLDGDGYPDIVAGNVGMNSFFQPDKEHPVTLSAKDFDTNNSIDPIVTYFNPVEKERFIIHNRLVLIDQVPGFKRRFSTFTSYATTPFSKSFRDDEISDAYNVHARQMKSMILKNAKGNTFSLVALPEITQLSSVNDILIEDLNQDGHLDLITVGNSLAQETLFGRYDASIGCVLLGKGKFQWRTLDNSTINFLAENQAQKIRILRSSDSSKWIVIVNNNGPIKFHKVLNKNGWLAQK